MHLIGINRSKTIRILKIISSLAIISSVHANPLCTHMGAAVICPDMVMEGSTSTSMSGSSTFWDDGSITSGPIDPFVDCPVPTSPSGSPGGPSSPGESPSFSGIPFDGFPSGMEQLDNTYTPPDVIEPDYLVFDDTTDSAGDQFVVGVVGAFGLGSTPGERELPKAREFDPVEAAGASCDAGGCELGSLEEFVDPSCVGSECPAGPLDDVVDTVCDDGGCDVFAGGTRSDPLSEVTFDDELWASDPTPTSERPILDGLDPMGPSGLETEDTAGRYLGDFQIPSSFVSDEHDIDSSFSALEGCVFVGCAAERGSGLKVPGFPSVPKNSKSEGFKAQYKERMDEIKKEGGGKSLRTQMDENGYRMASIRVRQEQIDKLIEKTDEGKAYLEKLKTENDETSANPYGDGRIGPKAGLKTGGFVATRLLARNPTPAGIVIGLFLDGIEGVVRYDIKSDLDDALEDAIESSGITTSGLIEVHRALSADLNAEIERKAELQEAKTETDALWHNWSVAAEQEKKASTRASASAVLRRDTDAAGDREEAKKPGGSGVTGARGAKPYKSPNTITPSR